MVLKYHTSTPDLSALGVRAIRVFPSDIAPTVKAEGHECEVKTLLLFNLDVQTILVRFTEKAGNCKGCRPGEVRKDPNIDGLEVSHKYS